MTTPCYSELSSQALQEITPRFKLVGKNLTIGLYLVATRQEIKLLKVKGIKNERKKAEILIKDLTGFDEGYLLFMIFH